MERDQPAVWRGQEERPRVAKRLGKGWGWESETWETRGPAAESRCGHGLASQSDPACALWPLTLLISFLSGLSTLGAGDGPYESFLEPHSRPDEQSQAERPPRQSFPPRSPSEWADQERLPVSSGLPRATP